MLSDCALFAQHPLPPLPHLISATSPPAQCALRDSRMTSSGHPPTSPMPLSSLDSEHVSDELLQSVSASTAICSPLPFIPESACPPASHRNTSGFRPCIGAGVTLPLAPAQDGVVTFPQSRTSTSAAALVLLRRIRVASTNQVFGLACVVDVRVLREVEDDVVVPHSLTNLA